MKCFLLVNPYSKSEAERYQPKRLSSALSARGVLCTLLENRYLTSISDGKFSSFLEGFDFGVYFDKDKYAHRILEGANLRLFNRAEAVELCDDKALTAIELVKHGIPTPDMIAAPLCYTDGADERAEEIAERLGLPVVVKECYGSLGKQVYLAKTPEELAALSRRLLRVPHLYQKFIKESAGRDLRVICVGGEPVAAMIRTSPRDFRSNIGLGGKGEGCEVPSEARALSRLVSKALSLDYCGIDFLFSKEGLTVCEVNSNAFFGGIEKATGKDVAGAFADHICREMRL